MRALALTAILAACSNPTVKGAGIQANVTVDPGVKADCVDVVATPNGNSTEHPSSMAKRAPQLSFGVGEGMGLSGTITLVARGYLGDCGGTPVLNAQSDVQTATFVEGTAMTAVTLELKGALNDADNDGYRAAAQGGLDCDDGNPAVNPGAKEACSDGLDNDCNGKIDCADTPACDNTPCDDGQTCTTGDACHSGACTGVSAQCNAPPGGCFHLPGMCLNDGGCTYAVDAGSPCDGGICASNGLCVPAGTEVLCNDGIDNDGDHLIDCLDPDCLGQTCNDSALCTDMDVCLGDGGCAGQQRTCAAPSSICFDAGTCVPSSGNCVYAIARGQACDDSNPCTMGDICRADAGCAGSIKACNTPTNACFVRLGVCDTGTGSCVYTPDAGAPCNDGDTCTLNDICTDAGTCQGTLLGCNNPPQCFTANGCLGDGGCNYTPTSGGMCNAGNGTCMSGTCLSVGTFDYVPSNFNPPDAGWSPSVQLIGCNLDFSSTTGMFTNGCTGQTLPVAVSVPLSDGKSAWLLPFGGLSIDMTSSLTLHGNNPVIIAVAGDTTIIGTIDGSSTRTTQGPGGSYSGCAPLGIGALGTIGSGRGSGGGGGAFGSAGSPGAGVPSAGGGAGGVINGDGGLVPLRGGCIGGNGGNNGGTGGNGGGAIQLSVAGTLTLSGVIAASGAGGQGGSGSTNDAAGAGAGSGGGILLEADALNISGFVLTNGGGGGQGSDLSSGGQNGTNGSSAAVQAAAGGSGMGVGGVGANGAAGLPSNAAFVDAAMINGASNGGNESGGGGGGGVGRIVLRAITSCMGGSGSYSGRVTKLGACP